MGVVYRSTHPRLEIPVAIKVLSEQYSSDASFRQRFHREAATVAALNHPGIVRVYDFDEDGPVLFIVMEWVEGRSMRSWLDEYGRFSVDVSVDLVQQLLSAVGVAHDYGIVHRDLKPDNILISNRGKTKILDFGISKLIDDKHRLTATGSMVGTPAYMAPEQVKGEQVDASSDIYSLGMILYELLHGEPPFTGQLPAVLHSQVFDRPRASTAIPSPIMEIIWKATAKDRSQRFQTCEEFSGAFHYMPKPAAAQPPAEAISDQLPVSIEVEPPRSQPPLRADSSKPPGVCTFSDCGERRGWACAYKDLTGRRQGRHRTGAAAIPEPQRRHACARPHSAPDMVGPQRGRVGTELVGAQKPGLPRAHRGPRDHRGAGHGSAADRQYSRVQGAP
jgi:serine/threonine-protein kinase